MTENYWTTGADDDQSGARKGHVTLDENGEPESVTFDKPAVLLHKRYELMTVVHPNGKPVQCGDIAAGQEVTVQFNHDKKTAVLLHVENNTCQVEK